jgi:hypothetical protein
VKRQGGGDDYGLAALAAVMVPVAAAAVGATLGAGFDSLGGAIGNAMVKNDRRVALSLGWCMAGCCSLC